jgi:RNA recognition motif-containing protein
VEYASREQAQNAVATLSNQNLMGRLVYVREDREAEPRFSNPGASRGGFDGGMRGGGAYGGGGYGAPAGGGGKQVYVANVCNPSSTFSYALLTLV